MGKDDASSSRSGPTSNAQQLFEDLRAEVEKLKGKVKDMKHDKEELTAIVKAQGEKLNAQRASAGSPAPGGARTDAPRYPKPEPYDGVGDVRPFLTAARAWLHLNPGILLTSQKILSVGSLLSGKALEWWEPTARDFLTHEHKERKPSTQKIFENYDNFENQLNVAFGETDEIKKATRQLTQLRQTGSAMHYFRDFRRIAEKLGWADAPMIELSYQGLKEKVKDDIYKETRPTRFDAFAELVIKADNRLYERELEKRNIGGRTQATFQRFSKGYFRNPANSAKKRTVPTSTGHHPGPMDLDATERVRSKGKCYNCGKEGHYANKCRRPKKKEWTPVPSRQISVMERVDHDCGSDLCYDATCSSYYGHKDQGERYLCMTNSEEFHEEDYGTQADWDVPPDDESLPDRQYLQGLSPVTQDDGLSNTMMEPLDNEEPVTPEIIARPQVRMIAGRDASDPRVVRDVIISAHEERPSATIPRKCDMPCAHPSDREHPQISWVSCVYDDCDEHLMEKLRFRFFPHQPTSALGVVTIQDTREWEVYARATLQGILVLGAPGLEIRDLQGRDRVVFYEGYKKEEREREWHTARLSPPSSANSRRTSQTKN
ncbi:MAG: hypothetical protein QXT77_05395 [Candidatus Methanomethylicaceae archaeon]